MLFIGREKLSSQATLRDQEGLSHCRAQSRSVCHIHLLHETEKLVSAEGTNPRKKMAFSPTDGQGALRMDAHKPWPVGIRSLGLCFKLRSCHV